jgi:hypothetical protein
VATKKTAKSNGTLKPATKKKEAEKDLSKTYNEFKEFEGQHYTGMRVWAKVINGITTRGNGKETKITPDLWEVSYAVTKTQSRQSS